MQVPSKPAKAADAGGARQGVATATGAVAQSGVAVADPALEELDHGAVVIAAITSCTNTSNPSVMIGAGLVAKKAVERGLTRKPWVKSSLAPGSKVVTEYLDAAGLDAVSRSARVRSGRLRLHDLHRQQRSAARRSVGRDPRKESGRLLGAERQPQLRGAHSAGRARQLPRVASARRRLLRSPAGSPRTSRRSRSARIARQARVSCKDIWPTEQELQETMQRAVNAEMFRAATPTCSRATSAGRSCRCPKATDSRGTRTRPTSASRRSSRG